ncbi:DUF995 domain-containing protein [Rhizobium sp. P44RR-XXIV]|uniref:DUF995 domain-containing protein n=1 Tax=Rhizobium sp. P44RR-XXIV TaxID=1921145 RepID=UPI0009878F66|nr:DUF995 domain-containing protein [Rhizobium sp. P44RR-XXIV]TIX90856.1 DUF995 domain-containing protein [Rhizobium sp. P44RR-XXIV]
MKPSNKETSFAPARAMILAIGLTLAAGGNTARAATDVKLPEGARPMTANELYILYRDKTWSWPDGAGRTQDADRRFSAWVDGAKGQSWAEGRWTVTDAGRLCFNAIWHATSGQFPAKTCFLHQIHDGTVYQRREAGGAWFVFRHPTINNTDEAAKLIADDLVSQRLAALKASISVRKTE